MRLVLGVSFALILAGCDSGPPPSPPTDPNKAVLIAYTTDNDLTRLKPDEASPSALWDALDPKAPKFSEFVKSGYETSDAFKVRIANVTGEGKRYVLILPALLTYDADTQSASFCPKWTMSSNPECVPGQRRAATVDVDSAAAGPFTILRELDVRANKLNAPLLPIKLPVPASVAKRVDSAGTARIAIVYTLDKPYQTGRFAETVGTNYDNVKRAKITVRRVVAYEQDGVVLAARDF